MHELVGKQDGTNSKIGGWPMKKRVFWLLSALLSFSLLLSACSDNSGNGNNEASPAATQTADQPASSAPSKTVPLTFFVRKWPNIKDLNTNAFTKFVEQKFNVKITWDITSEMDTKKPVVLASGEYDNVFFDAVLSKIEQLKYGQQGVFIPLNDLIAKYAPNIQKAISTVPSLKESITAPDGNIYALPQINECEFCYYAQKYWINTTWLKNLGLQMPTTTDQFEEVLKAFKEKDPNKNGKQDEIPLSGESGGWYGELSGFLMNAFIYDDGSNLIMNNGQVDFAANKPEWKKGLEYMHKLYSEGLIDKESFTQNADLRNQKINAKPDPLVGVVSEGAYNDFTIIKDGETLYKQYDAMPPLTGPDGHKSTAFFGGFNTANFAITNKATEEQKIAAIKIADYLYSEEGALFSQYGPNKEFWREGQAGEKDFNGNPAKYKFNTDALVSTGADQNAAWPNMGIYYFSQKLKESDVAPADIYALDASQIRLTKETKDKYVGFEPKEVPPQSVFVSADKVDTYSQQRVQIGDYVNTWRTQFIVGQKDLNKDWDTYLKGLDNLNVKQYLQTIQESLSPKK